MPGARVGGKSRMRKCEICGGRCNPKAKTCSKQCHSEFMRRINVERYANPDGSHEPNLVTPDEVREAMAEIRADHFVFGRRKKDSNG